MSALKDQRW